MVSSSLKVCQFSLVAGLRTSQPIQNSREHEEAERILADRRQRILHAVTRMNGGRGIPETLAQKRIFIGTLPGLAEETKRELECLTLHAADLLPVELPWQGMTDSPVILLETPSRQMVPFSPFDAGLGDANMLIMAKSGGGNRRQERRGSEVVLQLVHQSRPDQREPPVKKVKLFHEDNERVRFLDPETEYPKLLEEARNGPWYLEPIIVLDVNTGLRRRNILDLRWDQVDFKRLIIRIESRTKNGRPHNLPLNDTAFQKLKELHQKAASYPHVFVHLEGKFEGQPITDIKNAFNGAVDRAKIPNFRFHDLRHYAEFRTMPSKS